MQLLSTSQYIDIIGEEHFVGEVENIGSAPAQFIEININEYSSNGNLLATDLTFATVDQLGPGEKSPFDDTFSPPAGYSYSTVADISDVAGPTPNHYFTTVITNTYVDADGNHNIVGTVTNHNTTTDDFVNVAFTFYSGGTAVGADFTYINTGTSASLEPGQTASFQEIYLDGNPAFTNYAALTQSDTATSPSPYPDAPTQVAASATASSTAHVSWTAPDYDGTSAVTSYTVNAYRNGTLEGSGLTSGNPPLTSFTFATLTNGATYTFDVVATNGSGDSSPSAMSNAVLVAGVPGAPSNVVASSSTPGSAQVTWSAPGNNGSPVGSYTITTFNASRSVVSSTSVTASPATISALQNGIPYYFGVAAVNGIGTGPATPSNSVTPLSGVAPGVAETAVSTSQYSLPNSDGSTWQVMDETQLAFTMSPSSAENVLLSANADLWTFTAGYNQDLGIQVTAGSGTPTVAAWKEAGGFAGTFSPNAAFVETVYPMSAGTTYTVQIVWKTNKAAIGSTIAAGAGPIESNFSPTRLTADVLPTGYQSAVSTEQYTLSNNDGSTWTEMDATNLTATLSPSVDESAVVSGNADLWTANAGYNQDLGIFVSVNGATPVLVAWKESGGFAGTFSPNAAYVQAVYPMTAGNTYVFSLEWKTNKVATGATIYAGAGPIGSAFSPTRLTAYVLPADGAPDQWTSVVSTTQYALPNSDGVTWQPIDATHLVTTAIAIGSGGAAETVLVSGNADLWTANATYNQDLGIFVSVNGGTPALVAWKESGGFAGTFSPNAAFVQAVYTLEPGNSYVFSLEWKTNKPASGATIYAGAGPIGSAYSPTRLTVVPQI
jgi:hypothetical protein